MNSATNLITTSGGITTEHQIDDDIDTPENQTDDNINIDTPENQTDHEINRPIDTLENTQAENDSQNTRSPKKPDKITIKYYGTIPPLIITKETKVTNVDDILKLSRKYLLEQYLKMFPDNQGLFFVTAPLFGLIDEKHKYWLVSTDTLTCKSPTYYYRFQFCLPLESNGFRKLFQRDKFVSVYFFTQCRDDFINNRIPTLYTEEKLSEMLGFVTMDYRIPKYSYDYKYVTNQTSEIPRTHSPLQAFKLCSIWKHLPKKCRNEFYSPFSYMKLYHAIHRELRKEHDTPDNPHTLQREYVQGIFQDSPEYCIDEYSGTPVNELNAENKLMDIKIQPYKEPSGVYYNEHRIYPISDILDIVYVKVYGFNGMDIKVTVQLSSKPPEVIKFDYLSGLSFAYKLLGYHRIMVNYHIQLPKELDSSASKSDLKELKSFGPVVKIDAHSIMKTKLNDFKKTNMGITSVYLIAQDMEEEKYHVYCCSLCSQHQISQYPLEIYSGGYSVKKNDEIKTFSEATQLLTFLGSTFGRQIKPNTCNGNVWIQKIFSRNNEKTSDRSETSNKNDSGPRFFSPNQYIIDRDADKEGDLCLDIIQVRQSSSRETVMSMIQFKPAIPLPVKPITDDLIELSDILHKIKSSTFVKFYGVSTGLPYKVFVDYSPNGSLHSIITHKFRNPEVESDSKTDGMEITLLQFVTTATTVCKGLEYLWKNGLYHGNIKCKNVYVYGLTNIQFDVKIGHPGLVKFYNKQPLSEAINAERIPWIGVELFEDLSRGSIESEVYSFSTFVWEFLSYGKQPAGELNGMQLNNAKEKMTYFNNGKTLSKPLMLEHGDLDLKFKKDIKDDLWKLMCECWSVNPENRPDVEKIISRLQKMYSQYGTLTEETINIESLKQFNSLRSHVCSIIHAKQLKVGKELGKGHYGVVKQGTYFPDPNKRDCSQQVAVKVTQDLSTETPENRELKKRLFEDEIKTMEKAQHKYVIKIIGVCYKGESQSVVMELIAKGDLAKWLKGHKKKRLE